MRRRALVIAGWLVVTTVGVLGVLRPFDAPRTDGWFRGFWALYMVIGAIGTVGVLRARRLTVAQCLVAGGVGTFIVWAIAPTPSGLPLPSVVHSALVATGLSILAAARLENRPRVGIGVTLAVSVVFLTSALVADGAVRTALIGLFIGPMTAGVLLGAPLAFAVAFGNRMASERPSSGST